MKLVIFDCDGTLVDSQHAIVAAMDRAYAAVGLAAPSRARVLSIVGLSLPEVFQVLAPEQPAATRRALAEHYKATFKGAGAPPVERDPLFPGARAVVDALAKRDDIALGIATGKSLRGVHRLFDQQGWHSHFATVQTADGHPSKPHPSMIRAAIAETGCEPRATVMIGDTTFDMEMARAAGVTAIGVAWGYHPADALARAGAHEIVAAFEDLAGVLETRLGNGKGRR